MESPLSGSGTIIYSGYQWKTSPLEGSLPWPRPSLPSLFSWVHSATSSDMGDILFPGTHIHLYHPPGTFLCPAGQSCFYKHSQILILLRLRLGRVGPYGPCSLFPDSGLLESCTPISFIWGTRIYLLCVNYPNIPQNYQR